MSAVGKLALRTLISNKPLLQRSEVLRMVGQFAFEYGLFAGHEDLRVLGDISADIYVTYPHRSLEEFFGSFGFLQSLSEGQSVDHILGSDCRVPIFMVNPLVFRFCSYFLSSKDFNFPQRNKCYDKVASYVAKRIDSQLFDAEETRKRYPSIDLTSARNDHSTIQFFLDVLDKCKHITSLHVRISSDVAFFFGLMKKDMIDRIKTIIIGQDVFKLKEVNNNSLTLSIDSYDSDVLQIMNLLLQKYNLAERNPQICMYIRIKAATCDITPFLSKYIKELSLCGRHNNLALLKALREFPFCPILALLRIVQCRIDESVPAALSRAVESGRLLSLRSVELIKCPGSRPHLNWPYKVNVNIQYE